MANMTAARAKSLKEPGRYCARRRPIPAYPSHQSMGPAVDRQRRPPRHHHRTLRPGAARRGPHGRPPEPPCPVGGQGPHRGAPPRRRSHLQGRGRADADGAPGELAGRRARAGVGADVRAVCLPRARSDARGRGPRGRRAPGALRRRPVEPEADHRPAGAPAGPHRAGLGAGAGVRRAERGGRGDRRSAPETAAACEEPSRPAARRGARAVGGGRGVAVAGGGPPLPPVPDPDGGAQRRGAGRALVGDRRGQAGLDASRRADEGREGAPGSPESAGGGGPRARPPVAEPGRGASWCSPDVRGNGS